LTGRADVFSVGIDGALHLENLTSKPQSITMTDRAYGTAPTVIELAGGATRKIPLDLTNSHGWYDLHFTAAGQSWRIAGHVEDGRSSYSDPAAGGPGPLHIDPAAGV
jgi:phospholipase C